MRAQEIYVYHPLISLDLGGVLAEALKTMLCEDRQHDMLKAAAFVKRLATFSLGFGSAEAMAALVTSKHLLQKNVKCRNLLENDAGGGSVSGTIAKYQPYASDPNLSGALSSVLWELDLLSKHYHPAVSTLASSISSMTSANNQVFLSTVSPNKLF
ncbi:nucleolar complex-associated protein 3-like [Corylus avellana]|uniref:nucleolar complex-associated protein 3-like n=1 Tax=Corylus avellana TaxID=13451 RepID=UPI00286AA5C8|nr:nucleolar complex-associated protein 3-like [Corylus avellana]